MNYSEKQRECATNSGILKQRGRKETGAGSLSPNKIKRKPFYWSSVYNPAFTSSGRMPQSQQVGL